MVRICDCKYPPKHWSLVGAGGGSRTHTPLRAADFESAASAIPPLRHGIFKNSMNAPFSAKGSADPPATRAPLDWPLGTSRLDEGTARRYPVPSHSTGTRTGAFCNPVRDRTRPDTMAHAVSFSPRALAEHRSLAFWMKRSLEELAKLRSEPTNGTVHDLRVALRRCRSVAATMEEVDPHPDWEEMRG